MNILHLLSKFDSYDIVSFVKDLSSQLIYNGHNCIVASTTERQFFEPERLKIKYYQLPSYEINFYYIYNVYNKLKQIIKENRVDVLHSHSDLVSWIALFISRNTQTPLVNSCYNLCSKNIFAMSTLLGKKVIVHHEVVARHLINHFNLSKQRLQFIRQGLDLGNYNFQTPDERSKTDFNIGIISTLSVDKGHEYFLKALVKVIRNIPSIKIWIADSMPGSKQSFKEDIELLVRRLSLSNYVEFFDVSNLNLTVLSRLNILVSSSIAEDSSTRVILEAQALGVPVVASRVAGISEVVLENETGVLFSPRDYNALANTIIKMLRNFQFSRDIAFRARKRMEEEFNLGNNIKEFINLYKQLKYKKNFLIINTGKIQDVILSVPALRILRKEFPKDQLICLTNFSSRTLLSHCPHIDKLLIYDYPLEKKRLIGFVQIVKLLIKERFDVVIDFTNTFKTHLLSYLSLASRRYGYKDIFLKFLINYCFKKSPKSLSRAKDKIAILSLLGIETKDDKLELWPSSQDIEFVESLLNNNWVGKAKIVGFDISSIKGFFKKNNSLEHLAHLCDRLAKEDMRVIVIGSKDDLEVKEELSRKIKSKPIMLLGDIPIMQLASIIKKCDLYISSNLEYLHIASAMKIPSLILSTTKNLYHPLYNSENEKIGILTYEDLRLDKKENQKRRHSTMDSSKDIVWEKINRLIKLK